MRVVVESKRTLAHRIHPALRAIAVWFLMGVFETFAEPMFSAIHDMLVWLALFFSRTLLGA